MNILKPEPEKRSGYVSVKTKIRESVEFFNLLALLKSEYFKIISKTALRTFSSSPCITLFEYGCRSEALNITVSRRTTTRRAYQRIQITKIGIFMCQH